MSEYNQTKAQSSSARLDAGKWAPGKRPIAMRLNNGETWRYGFWDATLTDDAGKEWWHCNHSHTVQLDAHLCARKAWFAHHG